MRSTPDALDPRSPFQDFLQGVAEPRSDLTGDADFMPGVRSRDGPARAGRPTHCFRDHHATVGNTKEETTQRGGEEGEHDKRPDEGLKVLGDHVAMLNQCKAPPGRDRRQNKG